MPLSTEERLKINRTQAAIMRSRIDADQRVLDGLNQRIAELEEAEQKERGVA